ncbi:hypothetical protein [Rhizobium sp. NXC24]|uniref:hypothetical protein n=1 Tax=Rhizobium sp. NXC24 TaxID=2048897 RepID=UPI000CDF39AA|nr:hypothetical protein [Rhizobium sp. NXC24]AVA21588.1 hypothetical protein NXC24_CH01949 [Rhizobium sp. NXC24]
MTKSKAKNRKPKGERFFQMHQWLLDSAAWRATNVYERCLYMELKQRYNGQNNGDIPLSHREAEALLNCSNKPIASAFIGLMEKGFIRVSQAGSFHWKENKEPGGRATRWILTEYPVDLPLRSLSPTRDFMSWKPVSEKNSRYAESIPMVRPWHTMPTDMVGRGHTIKSKVYAHGTR